MSRVILIDNYDSFTYNLWHYLCELGAEVDVYRNDALRADEVIAMKPRGIVISPGPGTPDDAGLCLALVSQMRHDIPLLGVCLGHQIIAQTHGGKVVRAPLPMHGKTSVISHQQQGLFTGLPDLFVATRYHSLIVDRPSLPECLTVTAESEDGLIMGLQHREYPLHGVQFHPESIASEHGHAIIKNFLDML